MGSKKFNDEADYIILKMKAAGHSFKEITTALTTAGLKVSQATVEHRWRWISMTSEQRSRRRDGVNARRRDKSSGRVRIKMTNHVVTDPRLSPAVAAELDRRRALAPRSLTAALLGDPLPGYSALDQRRA